MAEQQQQQQYAFNNDPRLQSGLTTGVNGGGGRPLHIMIPRPPSSQEVCYIGEEIWM